MAGSNSAPKRRRISKTSTVAGHAKSDMADPAHRKMTLSFDALAEAADTNVNVRDARWKPSTQFEVAFEVYHEIEERIQYIKGKCLEEGATLRRRKNGLKNCVEIVEVVAFAPRSKLGREIRKNFRRSTGMEDAIIEIVKTFTSPQRKTIWEDVGEKLEKAHKEACGYCMLKGLPDVIKLLKGEISNDNGETASG